jgi:hypothetical protein
MRIVGPRTGRAMFERNIKTKETMTPEQLMNPGRYKVIAPYPGSIFKVGQIIQKHIYASGNWYIPNLLQDPDGFPSIFQPLPWYAERAIKDMPEFVKYSEYYLNHYHLDGEFKDKVFKVDKWEKGHYGVRATGESIIHGYEIHFVPATREEYEQWKQSKETIKK